MSNVESNEVLDDFKIRYRVVKWLKTMRIQTGLVTSLALWVGFISVSSIGPSDAIFLGAVGLLFHIFGFTLNEVKDYQYDADMDNETDHPVASGDVHPETARLVAWVAIILCILISAASPYPLTATLVLCAAVVPGYLYNQYSKEHWWSNIYLAMWAGLMVLAGALFAGQPTVITWLLCAAISIQIFVQVVEGDLKDINGSETTLCEKFGVRLKKPSAYINDEGSMNRLPETSDIGNRGVLTYTYKFVSLIYGLKAIELGSLMAIAYVVSTTSLTMTTMYLGIYFTMSIVFITSLSMVLAYVFDRSYIKKVASIHELSSIVLIGLTLVPLDPRGGVLVVIAPIAWYIIVNQTLHSGILNPDI